MTTIVKNFILIQKRSKRSNRLLSSLFSKDFAQIAHIMIKTSILLFIFSLASTSCLADSAEELLQEARLLFYQSIENEERIDPAIRLFRQVAQIDSSLRGRAQVYIGSLVAIKAKHAFWPHQKFDLARKGLRIMDGGLAKASTDIEALFIHTSTCYHLPWFFGRKEQAQANIQKLLALLPQASTKFDPELITAVREFLADKIEAPSEAIEG